MASVVVTGSSQGIGRAITERLANDGWTVVGLDRAPAPDGSPACADVVVGDTAERWPHQEAAARARALGALGGWVNNAGLTRLTPLHTLNEDDVRAIIEVNGFGFLWGCAAALEVFVDQASPGAIVNIGSIHGRASFTDHAAYEFTKGGVDALTRAVAVTYGPYGVRANTVAPGAVRTSALEASLAASDDPVAAEEQLTTGPPMRRIADPAEIASVVSFLLSDDASYVSGQSLGVDGAWSAAFGRPAPDADLDARFGRSEG